MASRTTKKLYPRYWGKISTTSAGSGWKRKSLGTAVPTDNEKLTLFMGATFSLAIDSVTRVRWVSLREAETLTLDEPDWAVLLWVFYGSSAVLLFVYRSAAA